MLWILTTALSATLPGVSLNFDTTPEGTWVLPAELPANLVAAGVQPGWQLLQVDGLKISEDPLLAQKMVATGPARSVRLELQIPEGEAVDLVLPRSELVVVEEIGVLSWPEGFVAEDIAWVVGANGQELLKDGQGTLWDFDEATGQQSRIPSDDTRKPTPTRTPELWWSLSSASWAVIEADRVQTGDTAWVKGQLGRALRLTSFQGKSADYLALPMQSGLTLYSISWPAGTPVLPICNPATPESCLVAGQQVASQLLDRPGAMAEATRMMTVACENGIWRACLEAVALEDVSLAPRAQDCMDRNVNACHEVAQSRFSQETMDVSPVLMGILEYSCSVDASGSLGERLRRIEEVGEGCMLLSAAFDREDIKDRALLSLDQACILGRAEACTEATRRREEAFALKTVRECENPDLPLASACVQLGKLVDTRPIKSTRLDSFGAYLRACKLGDEEGCQLLGDFVDRWGIENARVVQAENELLGTCAKGEQRACVGAAWLLVRHEPRSDAYGQALELFDNACQSGFATACIAGAGQRRIGKARKVEALTSLEMWQAACDKESSEGCAGLGERLSEKKATWEDAYLALTRACDTGSAAACTMLGKFVENRHKEPWQGEQKPDSYLQRGCENGNAEGCFWLAKSQVEDLELKKKEEPPEPVYLLLQRSCEGDYGAACAELASIHLERDTNFDDELAAKHLQSACDNGHFESCRDLSVMYMRGEGVEPDPEKARELAQRYKVNADRRLLRLGIKLGFPSAAGAEGELVVPIPVGPAISLTGSYSWVPDIGGFMVVLKGEDWPGFVMDYQYWDAGVRVYPNNKARGIYGMVGIHELTAAGDYAGSPFVRTGVSGRIGMYSENQAFFSRVEMGIGQYGMIDLNDWDEDQSSKFPLIQATLAVTVGFSLF